MRRGTRRSGSLAAVGAVVGATVVLVAPTAGTTAASAKVFYLAARPGQCLQGKPAKLMPVVPCSNPQHNLEVYAVVHGGWTGANVPAHTAAYAIARRLCNLAFARRFHHYIGRGYGWEAFWPDPGAEAAKYHDKIVCSLDRYPGLPAMGAGTHFRQAAAP